MTQWQWVLLAASSVFSALAGGALCAGAFANKRHAQMRQKALSGTNEEKKMSFVLVSGLYGRVLAYLIAASQRGDEAKAGDSSAGILAIGRQKFEEKRRLAGLEGKVKWDSFCSVRIRSSLAVGGLFALVGSVFSVILGVIGLFVGLAWGFMLPQLAIGSLCAKRENDLECELPQMLEVLALGLRSGLSFERSFSLYCNHFDTAFSRECSLCQDQWNLGLKTREQALKDLARGYESVQLQRVVDSAVRSLRFGSTLSSELEQAAAEARAVRQARRQEQVAKAPVKMMIPTGTLILPAMLMLVLGPVLLQMSGGIF